MAEGESRLSFHSELSLGGHRRGGEGGAAGFRQITATGLLNAVHTAYTSSRPHQLEPSTSLVINDGTGSPQHGQDGSTGGVIDEQLGRRAWEHARRRAEDGCIILASMHESTPSTLTPVLSGLPMAIPASLFKGLEVLKPLLHCVAPNSPSLPLYSSLAVTLSMSLAGELKGASLALSISGIDTNRGLVNVSPVAGHRAFDVFYYLNLNSSTQAEKDYLNLKPLSSYRLLNRSGTYDPPAYLPTADDATAAEDFRENLKSMGVRGAALRHFIASLVGLLKLGDTLDPALDQELIEELCVDAGELLNVNADFLASKCSATEREIILAGLYESLVDWLISNINETIKAEITASLISTSSATSEINAPDAMSAHPYANDGDSVNLTLMDVPRVTLGRALALRTIFDDAEGINAELKADGITVNPANSTVTRDMNAAIAEVISELDSSEYGGHREHEAREALLEKLLHELDNDSIFRDVLVPVRGDGIVLGKVGRFNLPTITSSSRLWFQLCINPTEDDVSTMSMSASFPWTAGVVSRQIRSWRLPDWANRRNKDLDYTADYDIEEFVSRYFTLGCKEGRDGVESWIMERGWSNGEIVVGYERVWLRESAWWEAECMLDLKQSGQAAVGNIDAGAYPFEPAFGYPESSLELGAEHAGGYGAAGSSAGGSREDILQRRRSSATLDNLNRTNSHSLLQGSHLTPDGISGGDYGLGARGDEQKGVSYWESDAENSDPKVLSEVPITRSRKIWVSIVWALTFWIPSPLLRYIGRMKRPDVRMAWREKLVLMMIIFFINALIVFYIVFFGKLLCPNFDKAWSHQDLSTHQGDNDFWVSHHGKVYDISKFWRIAHGDKAIEATRDSMQPFAGLNIDHYIVPPLTVACPNLVTDERVALQPNNSVVYPNAVHSSGPFFETDPNTKLHDINWYNDRFLPTMKGFLKGDLVIKKSTVLSEGVDDNHQWVIIGDRVYDLTDYFYTAKLQNNLAMFRFFNPDVESLIKDNPGGDITTQFHNFNTSTYTDSLNCLNNMFFVGRLDFRDSPKCKVNDYILLAFTIILCTVIMVKFLAALQLESKRRPENQDKFVICQVPAYTEGEDQLRRGLDSLTALAYDNKRKLIFVICDGMIVGGGNDRPTPKIVLDLLGVDPKVDPPALPFRSLGQGSEQLNYGKVYSGLYEYEGSVVPYIVVVKVGKESEQRKPKPGNRGKRDSQILLMRFLNRVHHRSPMSPLELEIFHQINNIIGVDPELYEFLLMVDADTSVKEDSLNRLVANCAHDAQVAGNCGETSLENEQRTWWTMIQVYEYYISHHLSKAFESLFGSVTCLPGCFCMYRLRTADKGRPLIISDKVIEEYSDCKVDTLHKKNLLSLGEDRYLTTLMTKHFPSMSYKFVPDAYASTAAPETWGVLLSQRRRWINSTIHNLMELVSLPNMCGFCCFSMRFIVFIDLFGTIILPATCAYVGYLIYKVASHSGQLPLLSIVILGAVYGLQAIIFLIKRQWQHIGWMIIYILAFPIYSFILPIHSFWKQDDFSWGSTRIVIAEKGDKQVVATTNDRFDPRSIPLQRWDEYTVANRLPGRRGVPGAESKKGFHQDGEDFAREPEDIRSVYSSVKPASTVMTGMHGSTPMLAGETVASPYADPADNVARRSQYSMGIFGDDAMELRQPRALSHFELADEHASQDPFAPRQSVVGYPSSEQLLYTGTPVMSTRDRNLAASRPVSTMNLQAAAAGPSESAITEVIRACLNEVDLETVTKKQLKVLTEQRLQTQLNAEKRVFMDQQIDRELAKM